MYSIQYTPESRSAGGIPYPLMPDHGISPVLHRTMKVRVGTCHATCLLGLEAFGCVRSAESLRDDVCLTLVRCRERFYKLNSYSCSSDGWALKKTKTDDLAGWPCNVQCVFCL
jgi:hypothetical protein